MLDAAEEADRNGEETPLGLEASTSSVHINGEAENDDDVEEGEIEDGEVEDSEVDDVGEIHGMPKLFVWHSLSCRLIDDSQIIRCRTVSTQVLELMGSSMVRIYQNLEPSSNRRRLTRVRTKVRLPYAVYLVPLPPVLTCLPLRDMFASASVPFLLDEHALRPAYLI